MKITSYNHHVRRLLSFREALVLKPRLPDSIEPSLLSNQFFRALCERGGCACLAFHGVLVTHRSHPSGLRFQRPPALTNDSIEVIFLQWNGRLSTPMSSACGGILSRKASRQNSLPRLSCYKNSARRCPDLTRTPSSALGIPIMKELRGKVDERQLGVLYAFDPRRTAILLIGGDKTGDPKWYERFVPVADDLFDRHLKDIDRRR